MKFLLWQWVMTSLFIMLMASPAVFSGEMMEEEVRSRGNIFDSIWHSSIWTREEDKHIVHKGDQVTVTPGNNSPYPTLVLKTPSKDNLIADFYFWEGVRLYAGDQPVKSLAQLKKASDSEPSLPELQRAVHIVAEAHSFVTGVQKENTP